MASDFKTGPKIKKKSKRRKRIITTIIVVFVLLFLLVIFSDGEEELTTFQNTNLAAWNESYDPDDTWAVYWYLCGSDLESEDGAATADLEEMLSVDLPKNVKVVIQSGGKPTIHLHKGAAQKASELGITEVLISISHCKSYATATAIAVGEVSEEGCFPNR